mgnify:CR=1 FL=1
MRKQYGNRQYAVLLLLLVILNPTASLAVNSFFEPDSFYRGWLWFEEKEKQLEEPENKKRSEFTKEEIEKIAVSSEVVVKFAAGAAIKKVIVVPGRLVNVVV